MGLLIDGKNHKIEHFENNDIEVYRKSFPYNKQGSTNDYMARSEILTGYQLDDVVAVTCYSGLGYFTTTFAYEEMLKGKDITINGSVILRAGPTLEHNFSSSIVGDTYMTVVITQKDYDIKIVPPVNFISSGNGFEIDSTGFKKSSTPKLIGKIFIDTE